MSVPLPPALQPWAEPLAVLDAELAIALGPLVRQIDQLVSRQDTGHGGDGPLDGYDGITRHGSPTRLLASEWALADAVPAEFLRRAANAELLYLEPAYQQDRRRGSIAVLVDTGPDQLGAARLVQLASLIVLLRRSAARHQQLSLGLLGDEPGSWLQGEPEVQLRDWLAARRPDDPDPAQLPDWIAASDETWILTGPRLARQLPGRRRLLITRECAWDPGGTTAAEVRLGGDRIELALPRHDLAIRALRGAAFRTTRPSGGTTDGGVHFGRFTGSPQRLMARGNHPDRLVVLSITAHGEGEAKPRRYRLPGPVIAAGVFSKRTVALSLVDGTLRATSIGKPLGNLSQLEVRVTDLGLTVADLLEQADHDLCPLHFANGALLCRLGDRLWRLHPTEPLRTLELTAIATSRKLDEPRTARRAGSTTILTNPSRVLSSTDRVVFGHERLIARYDGDAWLVTALSEQARDQQPGFVVDVPAGAEPFGLLSLNGVSTLLCYSAASGTIQYCTAAGHRTVTNWPRVVRMPSLHPFRPLLAIELADRVDVIDLTTDQVVASLRGDE